jgi:hypothetical protein
MTREGGCCCGAIRYRLRNDPLIIHACHCHDCQRITGSAFVTNLWIERKYVERSGPEPKTYVQPGGSGADNVISFCGACGTTLWSDYRSVKNPCLFVRAGTLDDPSWVVPDVHIFTRSKLSWVKIPDGAPAFATVYKRDEVWPPDKLARLRSNAET